MALSDRKIPIIAGRNDIPTTSELEDNHPNGSFLINKYNALIDNELTALETNLNNLAIPSTTDDLTEGTTNKYFSGKTTDDLAEGVTNKYYSSTQVNSDFDTRLATKTTDDLTEGTTNKYFADSLARLAISVTGNGSYDNATGVINISNATVSVDHISLTNTVGNIDTYTIWGDSGETITVGTFTVTNGINGIDGQGVDHASFVDNGNGTHTLTLWGDAGETINLGSTTLNDGVDGTNGVDGVDGQGIDHITSVDNLDGTHTITYWGDVSETINLGTTTLNDGVDGTNGVDGVSPQVSVLTQAAYDALSPNYDANTFYVING